jgi:hypothetical protein
MGVIRVVGLRWQHSLTGKRYIGMKMSKQDFKLNRGLSEDVMHGNFAGAVVKICSDIIDGRLDFVSGSRIIRVFYLLSDEIDKDLFLPIIGFESETDDYPLGSLRKRFSEDELKN